VGKLDTKSDLAELGLEPAHIDARPLTETDHNLVGLQGAIQGYKIPYYDAAGRPREHYRIRYFSRDGAHPPGFYPPHAKPWLYYPPSFQKALNRCGEVQLASGRVVRPVVIATDERAACSLTHAHKCPAVAIEGTTGWCDKDGTLAEQLDEFIEDAIASDRTLVLWAGENASKEQRDDLTALGLRLKRAGLAFDRVRLYESDTFSPVSFQACLRAHSRFPVPRDPRKWISERMTLVKQLGRDDHIDIAHIMLADMDRRGVRVFAKTTEDYYYFDLDGEDTSEGVEISLSAGSGTRNIFLLFTNPGTQTVSVWKDARDLGAAAGEIAVALANGTAMADIDGAGDWTSPGGTTMTSMFLAPVPITADNLSLVVDAGWITQEALCQGVTDGPAPCN